MKKITLLELNSKDVYVEYDDKDMEHVSYSKAKTMLKNLDYPVRYSASGSEAACNFLNALSRKKFLLSETTISPKTTIGNFKTEAM